jgi:hypothetical protein
MRNRAEFYKFLNKMPKNLQLQNIHQEKELKTKDWIKAKKWLKLVGVCLITDILKDQGKVHHNENFIILGCTCRWLEDPNYLAVWDVIVCNYKQYMLQCRPLSTLACFLRCHRICV